MMDLTTFGEIQDGPDGPSVPPNALASAISATSGMPPALRAGQPPAAPLLPSPLPVIPGAAPAAPAPALGNPLMGGFVPTITQTSGSSVSRVKPHKAEAGLIKEIQDTQKKAEELAAKQIAIKTGIANAQTAFAKQQEALAASEAAFETGRAKAAESEFAKAKAQFEADEARFQNMRYGGFWKDAKNPNGTGNKVLAAISIALSGIGDALVARSGGRSNYMQTTLNHIDNAIQRDWELYKDSAGRQERALERSGVRLEKLQDRHERLEAARKSAAYGHARAQLEHALAIQGVPQAEIEGHWMVNELRQRQLGQQLGYLEGLRERVNVQSQTTAQAAAAGKTAGLGIYGVGGQPLGTTGDPARDKDVRTKNSAFMTFDAMLKQYIDSYKEHGREVNPKSPEAQQRRALYENLRTAIKNNEELGALVGGDWAIIEGQIGTNDNLYLFDPTPRLEKLREIAAQKHAAKLDGLGLPGAQVVPMLRVGGPTTGSTSPAGGAEPGAIKTFVDKATGQTVRGRLGADGKYYEVE